MTDYHRGGEVENPDANIQLPNPHDVRDIIIDILWKDDTIRTAMAAEQEDRDRKASELQGRLDLAHLAGVREGKRESLSILIQELDSIYKAMVALSTDNPDYDDTYTWLRAEAAAVRRVYNLINNSL